MLEFDHSIFSYVQIAESSWPILICLLGSFRLLKTGNALPINGGGKRKSS